MPTSPHEFFDKFVLRSFEDFKAAPRDEYLGKMAVHTTNVMAERMWQHHNIDNPEIVFLPRQLGDIEKHLRRKNVLM